MQRFDDVLAEWLDEFGVVGANAVDPARDRANRERLQDDAVDDFIDLVWLSA